MLTLEELKDLAESRLDEAKTLHEHHKYDGAAYLCGYAVELALKQLILKERLCGFPSEGEEFELYKKVKTHKLEELLKVADKDNTLMNDKAFSTAWSAVISWSSEYRYRPIGSADETRSKQMLDATSDIIRALGIVV